MCSASIRMSPLEQCLLKRRQYTISIPPPYITATASWRGGCVYAVLALPPGEEAIYLSTHIINDICCFKTHVCAWASLCSSSNFGLAHCPLEV